MKEEERAGRLNYKVEDKAKGKAESGKAKIGKRGAKGKGRRARGVGKEET
jgi:hypothetical protein